MPQVFDFWGMYIYFLLILLLNVVRMGKLKKESFFMTLWVLVFVFTGLTVLVAKIGLPIQGIVGILILCSLATEVIASKQGAIKGKHGYFAVMLVVIGVAAAFSASDASRAWCDRSSHLFQGHAIWHCLGAVALYFSYFHYRQYRAAFV